ncbi:MAG: hypothetical protein KKA79_02690 [Nanoarchaeota archaeon]|nr:hypothetical protein [Nanoarchaeota archaeon]
MKEKDLFKKQRELVIKLIRNSNRILNDSTILKIITKIYSKKKLNKKEMSVLEKKTSSKKRKK